MYSQSTTSPVRSTALSPIVPVNQHPKLKDLFDGQPAEIVFHRGGYILGGR